MTGLCRRRQQGLGVLELAIGMAVFGLVLGGALLIVGNIWKQNRREETRQYLVEAKKAVLAFARVHGRLPKLDTPANGGYSFGDGDEDAENDYTSASIRAKFGWLPYKTLALTSKDAFGAQLHYSYHFAYSPIDTTKKYKLDTNRDETCRELKRLWTYNNENFVPNNVGSTGWYPRVWFDMSEKNEQQAIPVAAVIVSSGDYGYGQESNSSENTPLGKFDGIIDISSAHNSQFLADNKSAWIFFKIESSYNFRFYYASSFINGKYDDVLTYITLPELYSAVGCTAK